MSTQAVIHIDRFLRNFHAVKNRVGQCRICVPVKADAYGHGALQIAKTSLEAGAFCLGVASVSEGAELRQYGITAPILIFSQPHPEEIPKIVKSALIPFISDGKFAASLNEYAESKKIQLPVHLKIDTGMKRIGCSADESLSIARFISSCSGLELAGVATHFAVSDSTEEGDIAFTQEQLESFKTAVEKIKADGIDPGIVHAANSGAVILHPDTWFDMVRPGIFLYGYKTAEENDAPDSHKQILAGLEPIHAEPVMEIKTVVSLIKKVKQGETVSYGRTWTAPQDTNIGVLSIGYADGLPRLISNNWQVVISGKTYPLVGRITMDQCFADLGPQTNIRQWSDVQVISDAFKLASAIDTIPYEITCNISKRVQRIYKAYGVFLTNSHFDCL
ncbi:MAG: alanine racemase [Treponema sp.]|nr:alanine racemase [Treponema sp.]MCL2251293.1 alanine racemase [Treponema sp.]